MINLYTYLDNRICPMKLNKEQKEKILALDKEYGDIVYMFRKDRNWNDVLNIEEEFDKFIQARKRGIKYYPQLKFHENKISEDGILQRLEMLKSEFSKFNCFLSKYYIETLDNYITKVKFTIDKNNKIPYTIYFDKPPTLENYELALKTIKEHPYESLEDAHRTINAKTAQKELQQYIDKLDYKWQIELKDELMPRMCVRTDKKMYIKTSAMFSKEDLEGLKQHEIEGHIGRRYYGLKTGLQLFLYGLLDRNTLDEGLAVYNSLHKVEHQKKNILFNIALKTIVVYNLNKMDFCELFDFIRSLTDTMPDDKIFLVLVRAKREIQDMRLLGGWNDDASYFCGYQIIKKMSDKQRDDVLKYNIGPSHIKDLPQIKHFLKINKFEPLI